MCLCSDVFKHFDIFHKNFPLLEFPACSPALVVLTAAGDTTPPYQGRATMGERVFTLNAVTGADEGSYTVMDYKGATKNKVCLNVKGENTSLLLLIFHVYLIQKSFFCAFCSHFNSPLVCCGC